MTILQHALDLATAGFRVFPLVPNGKTPALSTDWQTIATADHDKLKALWTDPVTGWEQPYNIGVATGEGVVVLDVDVKDGTPLDQRVRLLEAIYEPLPTTYIVETPSGGRHYYFKTDERIGNSVGKLLAGVDVRGDRGYVVAEGSRIGDRAYQRARHSRAALGPADPLRDGRQQVVEPEIIPSALSDAIRALSGGRGREKQVSHIRKSQPNGELDTPLAITRATDYLRRSKPALEGAGGDDHTVAIANGVFDYGLSIAAAADLMADHWNDRCEPPWDFGDLTTKVKNAHKSRQEVVGVVVQPEAEFEPVEVEDRRTKPPRRKLYYERWREATATPGAPYLIKGWIDYGAMAVTYGDSNAGKSNVVLSQAYAIATGRPWCDARTRQGLVVYVAAEGGRGQRSRIAAYHKKYGAADIPFALVPCSVDLLRPAGDTKALIALVKAAEADFGQRCVVVVLDTLARVLAGGNENASEDMGALVLHCDKIREATGATVHVIHHSGKNAAAGARGHSSLRAATDTEIEIVGDRRGGTVNCTKQRDMDRPQTSDFAYEVVELGRDEDGDAVTSVVALASKATEFESRRNETQDAMLVTLRNLIFDRAGVEPTDRGVFDRSEVTATTATVKVGTKAWKMAFDHDKHCDNSGRAADKKFERDVAVLVANCDIDVVAVKGRESLCNLVLRHTATKSDMSQ